MDITTYSKSQLQLILQSCYKRLSLWSCYEQLVVDFPEGKTTTYDFLVLPDDSERMFILTSHRGASSVLRYSKGYLTHTTGLVNGVGPVESALTKKLVEEERFGTEIILVNLRARAGIDEDLALHLCRCLDRSDPGVLESVVTSLDLDLLLQQEQKRKEQAKKYLANKRSREFSLREQQLIGRKTLQLVEKSLQPSLNESIFTESALRHPHTSVHIRWSLPSGEYLTSILGRFDAAAVDLSGEELLNSMSRIFAMSTQDLLYKLFHSKNETCRRFALRFGDAFTIPGLIDADPKVRLLAKQKVGGK